MIRKNLYLITGHILAAILMTTTSHAQRERHPAYLHALSDLRAARWLLEHTPGDWKQAEDERFAAREINDAIREIRDAAIDDGKNMDERPMVDVRNEYGGHLRQALEYLNKARRDLEHEEDNAFARGLRNRSVNHIDAAMRGVNAAMANMHRPGPPGGPGPGMGGHPAYARAVGHLRSARWLLEHTAGDWRQGEDERFAMREISDAIREIKEAAADDGRNADERPMIQNEHRERGGHLWHVMEYLKHAREEVAREEDNQYARGLRNRSINHIDAAIRSVEKAMHH